KKYGPRNWSNAETLNLAIGQGANSQTVVNMAKFYSALATSGKAPRPEIAHLVPQQKQIYSLSPDLQVTLLNGLKAVTEVGGTAGLLSVLGVAMVYSAGQTDTPTAVASVYKSQILWLLIGFGFAYGVGRSSVRFIEWMTTPLYLLSIFLLGLTLVVGKGAGTA